MSTKSGLLSTVCVGPWKTVHYMEYRGVRCSGVAEVLKLMEGQSGLSELSDIHVLWVSAVEGCLFHCITMYHSI